MRKYFRKLAAGALIGAMTLSMAACGGSSDSGSEAAASSATASSAAASSAPAAASSAAATESKDGNITLGVAVQTLKATVYTIMRDNAVAKGKEEGVDVLYQSCELNAATQKNQVETMLGQGIDVLLLEPADMESMAATAQEARDAGIPVITMEMGIQGFKSDLWLTSNSYEVGRQQVDALLEQIGDEKANIVLFPGTVGDFVAEEISQGVRDAVAEHDNLTIVVDQAVPEWDRQKAMNLMEDAIVQTGGDIQAVIANNDNMALGARKAAENGGIADDVWFVGADNDEEMDQAILDGKKMITIDKGAVIQGQRMIEVAKKLVNGEDVPVDEEVDGVPVWYTPTAVVNADTVEEVSGERYPNLFK